MLPVFTVHLCGVLFDGSYDKLFTAWNNAIRDIFELPRGTHRYFIEDISDHLHPLVMINSRFIKFHQSLQDNPKPSVKFLSNISSLNNRTSYCQNLKGITRKCKEEAVNLTPQLIKRKMKYCEVEEENKWKTKIVKDLMELKCNLIDIDILDDDSIDQDTLVSQLCLRKLLLNSSNNLILLYH